MRVVIFPLLFLFAFQVFGQEPVVEFRVHPCLTHFEGPPRGLLQTEVEARILVVDPGSVDRGVARGVQGWSMSIAAESIEVVDVSASGTVAADSESDPAGLREGGFEKSEIAYRSSGDCEGRPGAVSAVVLSFVQPVFLPADEEKTVLRLRLHGEFPESGAQACFFGFVDGCYGSG